MPKPEKVEVVKEIAERFSNSQAALLTEYRGLTVGEMAEVRAALRDAEAEYKVLKNTLASIAAREVGLDELTALLDGPIAIAFVKGDAVEAAKALDDAARRFPVLALRGGVLRGRVIDADQAKSLATLEPREVQLAKIAMLSNSPMQRTVNVFSALLRDLGAMLAQVVQKKESGELGADTESPQEVAPTGDAAGDGKAQAAEPAAGATDASEAEARAEASQVAEETPSAEGDEVAAAVAAQAPATEAPATEDTEQAEQGEQEKEE